VRGEYQDQELYPNQQGWLWSHQLQLFLGIRDAKLRFFTPENELVPTPTEAAKVAQRQTEKLAAKLRELGIDPEAL
jgi:hypothetical protein